MANNESPRRGEADTCVQPRPNCAHCGQPIEPPFVPLAKLATGYKDGTRAVHQHCWQAWLAGGSSPSTPSTESTGGKHDRP